MMSTDIQPGRGFVWVPGIGDDIGDLLDTAGRLIAEAVSIEQACLMASPAFVTLAVAAR